MTISRVRLAIAATSLVVIGAVGGDLVIAAATPPIATTDAAAARAAAADEALRLDSLPIDGGTASGGGNMTAQVAQLRDRVGRRVAKVRGQLVHGTVMVLDRNGALVTYQLDHGTVTSIIEGSITIAEAGSSSVNVATTTDTRFRKDAKASTLANLQVGDEVVIRSTVSGGSATARIVIVPPPTSATAAPSSGGNG